ncbi:MAG: IS3 family transposase [Firmicutes bacterium]|nr:IS3 family transposase [Bacillota bacterium]
MDLILQFPLRLTVLHKVSRSEYYRWLRRPEKRSVDVLGQKVKRIFQKSRKTYGTRRIKKQLAVEGVVASRQRISRKMAEQGLVAKARRKTRATTDSNHDHPVAPNLLGRQFSVHAPNKVWVTDITYLATSEGWLYLAIVLDLYSRKIVGWSIRKRRPKNWLLMHLRALLRDVIPPLALFATRTVAVNTVAMLIRNCFRSTVSYVV